MTIRWTPEAASDLEQIMHFLDEMSPHLSMPTAQKIYTAALSLRTFPFRGRRGDVPNTRELILLPMPYIIAYRVKGTCVEISVTLLGNNRAH